MYSSITENFGVRFWRPIERVIFGFQSELKQLQKNGEEIPSSFRKKIDAFISYLKSFGVFAEYHLERNGNITVALFSQNNKNTDILDGIANQCFYFLKDIAHRHQHHNPRDDSLICLHPMDANGTRRQRTLQSLHGTILEARNFKTRLNVCVDALGIIEYARVFCEIHKGVFPFFMDETLSGSLASRIENMKLDIEHKTRKIEYFMYSLRLIAICIAFGMAVFYFVVGTKGGIEKFWNEVNLPTWFVETVSEIWNVSTRHFPEMITFIAFCLFVVWYGLFSAFEKNKIAARAIELVVAFPFSKAAFMLFVLSVFLGFISFLSLQFL